MFVKKGNDTVMNKKKNYALAFVLCVFLLVIFIGCGSDNAVNEEGYKGINVDSPKWIGKLDAAKSCDQMFVVAAFDEKATDAWVSMHEKQEDGSWIMTMTTPGFIGKNGLGKTKEGDAKTPTGIFHFNRAFGIADDPGCKIPYVKVDDDTYWSGDPRKGYHYNELVSLKDLPDLDIKSGDSEHIIDYPYHYQYCLNISYNEKCKPGLGSGIFLHCLGPAKPFTAGCVSIPEDHMKYVMQHVDEKTVIVIDSYDKLSCRLKQSCNIRNDS